MASLISIRRSRVSHRSDVTSGRGPVRWRNAATRGPAGRREGQETWLGGVNVEPCAGEESNPAFDEAVLLDSVGGDVEFLVELIGLFLAACPTLLSRIQEALATHDFAEAERAVRILRGALRSFAAADALKSIQAMEPALQERQSEHALEAFREIERQVGRLISGLSKVENSHLNCGPSHGVSLSRRF
jgi:HPt (histidine-containing phosphotransfer) domain-containing protein